MDIRNIEKGARVKLQSGWLATLKGKPGNKTTVLAEVEGLVTEIGSVYCHEIMQVQVGGEWELVEHTKTQLKLKETLTNAGFYGGA